MKNKIIGALLLASTLVSLAVSGNTVNAEEIKENDNTYYIVEAGDTLSSIAEQYGLNFTVIHGNNDKIINHEDLIFVDQKLLVGGVDFDTNKAFNYGLTVTAPETVNVAPVEVNEPQVEVEQETVVEPTAPVQEAVVVTSNDGSPQYAAERMAQATGTSVSTWLYIIEAESGNNPHIVNSIGCYGYFQIHPVHGMPYGASVDTQIEYAIKIYNSQGFQAWEVM